MTVITRIEKKCSVCGKPSSQIELLSTNQFGASDLDLRPPPMRRDTMNTWIYECQFCGYVASNLEDELIISKEFLKSEEYCTCDGFNFKGDLSKLFYKNFLILKQRGETDKCYYSLRNCAWDCDDHQDENAIAIRKLALTYLEEIIQKETVKRNKNTYLVVKADILRRSGEFKRLISEYKNLKVGEELLDKIIQFQIKKANKNDAKCYTVANV